MVLWLPVIPNMGNGRRCRDVIELNDLVEFFWLFLRSCFFCFLDIPGSIVGRNRTICIWATSWKGIRIRWRRIRRRKSRPEYRMVSMELFFRRKYRRLFLELDEVHNKMQRRFIWSVFWENIILSEHFEAETDCWRFGYVSFTCHNCWKSLTTKSKKSFDAGSLSHLGGVYTPDASTWLTGDQGSAVLLWQLRREYTYSVFYVDMLHAFTKSIRTKDKGISCSFLLHSWCSMNAYIIRVFTFWAIFCNFSTWKPLNITGLKIHSLTPSIPIISPANVSIDSEN